MDRKRDRVRAEQTTPFPERNTRRVMTIIGRRPVSIGTSNRALHPHDEVVSPCFYSEQGLMVDHQRQGPIWTMARCLMYSHKAPAVSSLTSVMDEERI